MGICRTAGHAAIAAAFAIVPLGSARAADELNVAYFLEWATPNLIAKVDGAYEEALGVPVNWVAFDTGTAMTDAMASGDIDISYSQGLAPFITAVNADVPIRTVGIAVQYPANDCVVRNGLGIDSSNANELEGMTVAVPLSTMADYSFRMQMRELGVDESRLTIVDQAPNDGAVALADGSVDMACVFGGLATAKAKESGASLMSGEEMEKAGIISFDVVSVLDSFAQENPDLVRGFMDVTGAANSAFTGNEENMAKLAAESGMSVDGVLTQMEGFLFPSADDQLTRYFNEDGLANDAIGVVGGALATADNPAKDDYSASVDTAFLK